MGGSAARAVCRKEGHCSRNEAMSVGARSPAPARTFIMYPKSAYRKRRSKRFFSLIGLTREFRPDSVHPSFIHSVSNPQRDHAQYAVGRNTTSWKMMATA